MRLTRTFNAGYDNLYLSKNDVERLLDGQKIKESSLIVQMEKPENKWVGLTRTELIKCGVLPFGLSYELYQAIEANLKEKNT